MKRNVVLVKQLLAVLCSLCMLIAAVPVSAEPDVTAQIVLETTGEPPADNIAPMYETLRVKLSDGSTPTGYQWWLSVSENAAGAWAEPGCTGDSYRPPSRYLEWGYWWAQCVVTYDGGTATTQWVRYNKDEYPRQQPVGWDNKIGGDYRRLMPNPKDSNPDYVFYVDGKGFVVANERNVQGSAYFVVALDAYGDIYNGDVDGKGSDTTWKNYKGKPLNESNDGCEGTGLVYAGSEGAATMQSMLLGEGNTFDGLKDVSGNAIEGKYALPDIFDNYIDMDHSWPILANSYTALRSQTSGVALLGYNDFINYQDRIGWSDNVYSKTKGSILLRDLYYQDAGNANLNYPGRIVDSGGGVTSDINGPYVVRPCFWLKKDFFEKNAIDLVTAGSGILNIMKNATYTDAKMIKDTYIQADKQDEYDRFLNPDSQLTTTVRSGVELADVKLLDTLVANVEDGAEASAYKWQTSAGGKWTDIEGATSKEYIVNANDAGNFVCCAAMVGDKWIYSKAVSIPNYAVNATGDGAAAPEGTVDTTPAAYKFTVDGKGFVLLDTFDNDESTYYVTTTDAYGDMKLLTEGEWWALTYKHVNVDAYNSSGFLSNGFLADGNNFEALGKESQEKYKLPQGIADNINQNHVWWRFVDAGLQSNPNIKASPTYKTGVSFLSWTDFTTYAGKLGVADVFQDSNVNKEAKGADVYFIRDTNNWGGGEVAIALFNAAGSDRKCIIRGQSVTPYGLLRPAFYLKKDFFKTTKIDLATAGETVLAAMRSNYYIEDLDHLYPMQELYEKGFSPREYAMKAAYAYTKSDGSALESLAGAENVKATVTIKSAKEEAKDAVLIFSVADADNMLLGVSTASVSINANGETMAEISLVGLENMTHGCRINLFLWESGNTMRPLTGKLQ